MKVQNSLLLVLALANYCFAAKYSIDASCRSSTDLLNGIIGGIHEGLDLAANAFTIMTDHADDQWVQKMAKYILGTIDYDGKFGRAKGTFAAVMAFEKDPSPLQPQDVDWKSVRSNTDLEIYCSMSRITRAAGSPFGRDTAMENRPVFSFALLDPCYESNFVIGSGQALPKALTKSSDLFNYIKYKRDQETNPDVRRDDYVSAKPHIACTIDICTWFTTAAISDGWPTITAERVDKCKTDEFKAGLEHKLTPIDGLKTFGSTMLHELTHTIQGGRLVDIPEAQRPEGVNDCYNWVCVGELKTERNADSIAMLGIAMKLWSLGHYAEDDGTIHPIS